VFSLEGTEFWGGAANPFFVSLFYEILGLGTLVDSCLAERGLKQRGGVAGFPFGAFNFGA
jgi:hypothetical protein